MFQFEPPELPSLPTEPELPPVDGPLAAQFTNGLASAFYAMTGVMVVAAIRGKIASFAKSVGDPATAGR